MERGQGVEPVSASLEGCYSPPSTPLVELFGLTAQGGAFSVGSPVAVFRLPHHPERDSGQLGSEYWNRTNDLQLMRLTSFRCSNPRLSWSAMYGSNVRPPGPRPGALPGCANRR